MSKGMKNIFSFILVLFLVSLNLFASWNVGDFVDEFEDPTGDHFLYTTVMGTFSSTATRKADSPLRVLFYLLDGDLPEPVIQIEPHTYGWNYDVDDFYDDSSATIKFKDDSGTVYSFYTENEEDYHYWNRITGKDALKIVSLLKNNKTLKIYISIESYTFNYTVDCSDFAMLYQDFMPEFNLQRNKWELSPMTEDGFCSASIFFDSEDKQYGFYLNVFGSPKENGSSPSLWGEIYYEDLDTGLFASVDSSEVDRISFSVDENTYEVSLSSTLAFSWFGLISTTEFEWSEFYKVFEKKGNLIIDIYMTTGETISFKTFSSEFLKYTKYPYDFI